MINKNICKVLLVLIFFILSPLTCFSADIIFGIENKGPGGNMKKGEELIITGDSYANRFIECCMRKQFFKVSYKYSKEGRTTSENYNLMAQAMASDISDTVMVCVSVNDYAKSTYPIFKTNMEYLTIIGLEHNKKIIFHTYMDYIIDDKTYNDFTIADYDKVLRDLAEMYENVYYIDMTGFDKNIYLVEDGLHYDFRFYDVLYNKFLNLVEKIRSDM